MPPGSLKPPPIVRGKESNAGDPGCARCQASWGIGGGHAAQGKDGNAARRGASSAEAFQALGRRGMLLENRREEQQIHLFF